MKSRPLTFSRLKGSGLGSISNLFVTQTHAGGQVNTPVFIIFPKKRKKLRFGDHNDEVASQKNIIRFLAAHFIGGHFFGKNFISDVQHDWRNTETVQNLVDSCHDPERSLEKIAEFQNKMPSLF